MVNMGNIPQQPSNSEEQASLDPLKSPLLLSLFDFFKIIPSPYSIFLFSVILATILLIGSRDLSFFKSEKGIGALFQSITTGYFAWAIIYSYQTFVKHKEMFMDLIKNELEKPRVVQEINHIYTSKTTCLIVIIIAISLFYTFFFPLNSLLSSYSPISFYFTFVVFSLVTGFAGTTVLLIGRFMIWYSKIELSSSIIQYPYSPLRFIGRMQLKFALITTVGFFLGAVMTRLYWGINGITIIWLFIGIIFVIGFFFFPQNGFHKKIKEEKSTVLKDISNEIQRMFEDTTAESKYQNFVRIKEMYEFATLISKLPSWPFDVKPVVSIFVAFIPSFLILLLQVFYLK